MLLDDRDLLGKCLRRRGEIHLRPLHPLSTQALRQGHPLEARQLLVCHGKFGCEEGKPGSIGG
jgi:hypothetical protein